MKPTVLLVHGAWHSGQGFDLLQAELAKLDINSKTVELSSVAAADKPIGDMYQDAQLVRDAILGIEGECVVLGHSYGGLPITQGTSGLKNVKSLIYLTAFMLDEGETLYQACGAVDPEWWIRKEDNLRLQAGRPKEIFYNKCSAADAQYMSDSLRDQSLTSFNQPITNVAWKEFDSTYIICEADNAIPVFAQEAMSSRAKNVIRMDADHSPFRSCPTELAEIINKIL